jgi:CBS domain-containing protein/ribosome-associated translation inhibitor RaiA
LIDKLRTFSETELVHVNHDPGSIFHPDDATSKVLGYFKDTNRYEAVARDGANIGLVTIRDLLGVTHPDRTKIHSIWEQVAVVDINDPVMRVVEILIDHSIRALPMTEKNEVNGIVSQFDLLKGLKVNWLDRVNAQDLMVSPVVTINSDESVSRARRTMLDKGISHLPVLKEGKLVGLITAEILVHTFVVPAARMSMGSKIGQKNPSFSGPVNGVMDKQPLTLDVDVPVSKVLSEINRMDKSACLLVNDKGGVVGIITPREILRLIYDLREEKELPVYIMGLSPNEDWFDIAIAEGKVRRVITRAQNMLGHLTEARINVESQREKGNRTRYEVRAHIYGKPGWDTLHISEEGWDLLEVFDNMIKAVDKKLRDMKQEPEKGSRRGRSNRMKPYDIM